MKKDVRLFFVIIALFLSTCIYAMSYRVTAERLNVRERPSAKANIVCKLSKGDVVEGERTGKWVEITYNGQRGFVSSKYVEEVTYQPSQTTPPKSYTLPTGPLLYWLLGIIVAYVIGRKLNRNISLKDFFGVVIAAIIVPIVARFIFGLFGLPTLGYILGWVVVVIAFMGVVNGDDNGKTKNISQDYDNPSDYNYGGSAPLIEQKQIDDDIDDDDDYDNRRDDYEERRREYEEQQRLKEEERKESERSENKRQEEYWRDEYERYHRKADDAKSQARTHREFESDCLRKAHDLDDESYLRDARNNADSAEICEREYEDYQRKADEAEKQWEYYRNKTVW